jgi:hypothetical protein
MPNIAHFSVDSPNNWLAVPQRPHPFFPELCARVNISVGAILPELLGREERVQTLQKRRTAIHDDYQCAE